MIEQYLNQAIAFCHANPTVVIVVAVALAVLTFSRPKDMFKLYAFLLFLLVVGYFIALFMGTIQSGSEQKDRMIYKSRDVAK